MREKKINLRYGQGSVELAVPERNLLSVLEPAPVPVLEDLAPALEAGLRDPIGLPPLAEIVAQKKPESALVLLSDHTREVPRYPVILKALLDGCSRAGIPAAKTRLLIAGGTHRQPTCEEREELYGKGAVDAYPLYAHDCDLDCISLGVLSSGHPLGVNRLLLTSDLIIATGKITPHYLAGFSGGRKAVLPGCASREAISLNHAMVARGGSAPGVLKGNPIHDEMDEAASKVGIDFIINVVPSPGGGVVGVFGGHWRRAFERGAELCRRAWSARFERPADCVIASAGGYPSDINLYQIQRVLNNVAPAIRPGGTAVIVGECREGVGQREFGEWMERYTVPEILSMPEERITAEAHRAYSTAAVMERMEVVVVGAMDPEVLGRMKFRGFPDLDRAVTYLAGKHGPGFECHVVTQGHATMVEPTD